MISIEGALFSETGQPDEENHIYPGCDGSPGVWSSIDDLWARTGGNLHEVLEGVSRFIDKFDNASFELRVKMNNPNEIGIRNISIIMDMKKYTMTFVVFDKREEFELYYYYENRDYFNMKGVEFSYYTVQLSTIFYSFEIAKDILFKYFNKDRSFSDNFYCLKYKKKWS